MKMNTIGHLMCRKDVLFKYNAECLEKTFHLNAMQNWQVYDMSIVAGWLTDEADASVMWQAGGWLMWESQLAFL